jgi:hypothetical protein
VRTAWTALVAGIPLLVVACGRTGIVVSSGTSDGASGAGGNPDETPVVECATDADCAVADACSKATCHDPDATHAERYCAQTKVSCDDGNVCTVDKCDPTTGACMHQGPVDADHDGVLGKASVFVPDACGGPDCDDTSVTTYPGAPELCDGKDNNCNGEIDEGATYAPAMFSPVLVAPSSYRSTVGGFAFDGTEYGVTYTDTASDGHGRSFLVLLNATGGLTAGPSPVSEINADSFAGGLANIDDHFVTAWADARQASNYEIYATRFDSKAQKLEADQRLTDAQGFSLQPSINALEQGYVVVWQDRRFKSSLGINAAFGRKLTLNGVADGDEVQLTGNDEDADSPGAAVASQRIGVTYTVPGPYIEALGENVTSVQFRSLDPLLADSGDPGDLGQDGQAPSIVSAGDGFVVAWHTGSTKRGWGSSIHAVYLDQRGDTLATKDVTTGDAHAKTRALLSLGDRVLLVWSATPHEGDRYQLFYEVLSAKDLSIVRPRQLLASSGSDLTDPALSLGPNGDIGVVFEDSTKYQAYFTRLGCAIAGGGDTSPPPR